MNTFFLFISQNFIAVTLLLLSITALIIYEGRKGGKKLSPSEATRKINKENALVLDLRPSQEFSSGHIAGSINVQEDQLDVLGGQWYAALKVKIINSYPNLLFF